MTPEEIGRLAEMARRAGVRDVELNGHGLSLRLHLDPAAEAGEPPAVVATEASRKLSPPPSEPPRGIRSPGVGLFRHDHPLTGKASSQTGQHVEEGQIVGFLDAGSVLRAVTAPAAGTIGAPLCQDGSLVGYGSLLYPLA